MDVLWHVTSNYEKIAPRLPPALSGRLDLLRSFHRAEYGGPMNGQAERQRLVLAIAADRTFDLIVETGAYRGTTTEFLAKTFECAVRTVECHPRHFVYSRARLRRLRNVSVEYGDSAQSLRRLGNRAGGRRLFAYLDAHWYEDLPLRAELGAIKSYWPDAIVMIDDFEVPHDPGYGFDDYGPGAKLDLDYLRECRLEGWTVSFPTASSDIETGWKRGCCVLLPPQVQLDVAGLTPPRAL